MNNSIAKKLEICWWVLTNRIQSTQVDASLHEGSKHIVNQVTFTFTQRAKYEGDTFLFDSPWMEKRNRAKAYRRAIRLTEKES